MGCSPTPPPLDPEVHTEIALRSFAIPPFDSFAKFLVIDDPLEVGPLSRRGSPLSAQLPGGIRFLQHPLPAAPSVHLAVGLASREAERRV